MGQVTQEQIEDALKASKNQRGNKSTTDDDRYGNLSYGPIYNFPKPKVLT